MATDLRPYDELCRVAEANGLDVHRLRAADMYGVTYDNVTSAQRHMGKLCNTVNGMLFISTPLGPMSSIVYALIAQAEEAERQKAIERQLLTYASWLDEQLKELKVDEPLRSNRDSRRHGGQQNVRNMRQKQATRQFLQGREGQRWKYPRP